MADAEGHVLGNFHAYYSFNPVHERLRFMDEQTSNALRRALLVRNASKEAAEAGATTTDDVANFDLENISTLNERMQKKKKQVEYVIRDDGDTNHRRRFVCELEIDGQRLGHGEGVSKKVAKAKAAEVALRALDSADKTETSSSCSDTEQQSRTDEATKLAQLPLFEEELANRKPLMVLGVDIDDVLVARATKKPVQLTAGDAVQFIHSDVTARAFHKEIFPFLELSKRPTTERKFDLVTCFSVTMWIHLNHGDDGLWKFLETVSDMVEHLIIEPQTWKCYRYVRATD
ncbi:hypothetical protein BBJ28_00009992 [Nothophytophthora sp. Chile5]|nr:hypothetical protein BBJ28_00009992 [Nothophytophthora sp. Chile5]